jgi:tetratricopeptide (TPR) repeat protein
LIYVSSALCVLIIGLVGWGLGRYLLGEYYTFVAVLGATKNDALSVYNNQQHAITAYPYSAAFRRNYSNTNMVIALNLSTRPNLTDQEKQQVVSLVQQSINEGKIATTIQPTNSINWVNLARIYTNLIGTVQGSDSWAVAAYSQAITTAPSDPILHLEAGGLMYRLNQPQQAVQIFEQTVQLKPDWPNAYYNLASAYKLNKENEKAIAAYKQAISLLSTTPDEQKRVQSELDQFQKDLAQPAQTPLKATTAPKKEVTASDSALISPTATEAPGVSTAAKDALKNVSLDQGQGQ